MAVLAVRDRTPLPVQFYIGSILFLFKSNLHKFVMTLKTTKEHKYNYFYKITNLLNGHFYYGVHSTDNLDDGYMGSGIRLNYAYKKYGIENFEKEILNFFKTREELVNYEAEIVNETLVKDSNCYNIIQGGEFWNPVGMVVVYDLYKEKWIYITSEEYRNNLERYKPKSVLCKACKDPKTGKLIYINRNDPDIDKYEAYTKGKVVVQDKYGNFFRVNTDDERIKNGELHGTFYNKKHSVETKEKWKETYKRIKHQQGETNSQYGKVWIIKDGISKSIFKEDLEKYLNNGWKKGRKCNFTKSTGRPGQIWINNGIKTKQIYPEELEKYSKEGWKRGRNINKY